MGLSIFYGTKGSDEERLKFLDYVYESGEANWDSSNVYGDSEDLLGKYGSPFPFPCPPTHSISFAAQTAKSQPTGQD